MHNPKHNAAQKRRREKTWTNASEEGLTNQAFKDECDINRVLDRAKKGVGIAHLANYQGVYGDFSDMDANTYEAMVTNLANANSIFHDLGAELRAEFDNNPGKFFEFVNNPENKDRLEEIFPTLAAPGKQFPDVIGGLATAVEKLATASSNAPPGDGASEEESG